VIRTTRRAFLGRGAAGLASALAVASAVWPAVGRTASLAPASRGTRLVIVGASVAGISLARAVRRLAPQSDIVLVDREPFFLFAPRRLAYAFGLASFREIARDYEALTAQGLPVVRAVVIAIDRDHRRVVTTAGTLDYDCLALAAGLRLLPDDVPGLADASDDNVSPYGGLGGVVDLRRRIAGFRGGHVVIATPSSPYPCPPAPYEYALLWAQHIERRRLPARVTLLDPRSRPTPPAIAEGLVRAMEAHTAVLAYEPFTRVRGVNRRARTAETEAGRLSYDLLSVIPPSRAMPFVAEAGLGSHLVDVDPRTFRSARDERIYALGDNADTPYAKTAYTAMDSARVAAHSIAGDLGVRLPAAAAPANVCYPMVAPNRALLIEARWSLETDGAGAVHVTVSGRHDVRARASYARQRRQWEGRALSELFGR
jgi:NADPH-dependent 2,4-dienoyl-CoA reductase/sulfur reductase-like enzyme